MKKDSTILPLNYPVSEREILDGSISVEDNVYIQDGSCCSAVINVENFVFDTVTIVKDKNKMGYAFLAARPEAYVNMPKFPKGYAPSYAAGCTGVVFSCDEQITVKIPDNARYLYIHNSGDGYLPSAILFAKNGKALICDNSVRIATWNIGHFSLGQLPDTIISDSEFDAKSAEYEDYIYNVLNADVIALNEYSKMFTASNKVRDTVFSKYPVAFEGIQKNYSCNTLYAKGNVTNIQAHEFECNKTADMESPYGIFADDYYYVTADLAIGNETVKLVSAHLAFYAGKSVNPPAIVDNQIKELIEVCKAYDKVVLMGDWNCVYNKFQLFTEAGYALANTEASLSTYSEYAGAFDNIIYKGVGIRNFGLAGTKLSDHYAIYCDIFIE